jgi:hypothetical protein
MGVSLRAYDVFDRAGKRTLPVRSRLESSFPSSSVVL